MGWSSDFLESQDPETCTSRRHVRIIKSLLAPSKNMPDDPPPKSLRRIKRVAVRRRSRHLRNVGEIIEHHLHPNSVTSKQTESGSSSYAHQPSTLEWDARKHSNWTVIQKTSSCMSLDTEIDCPSEDSGTSLSSCTCDDYLTDTSNSTNEEDD
ncbi:unnamed protein product [Schistosoma intercalatum]|nr:unnamed protein product [Schistosoma intercalatum]CAH8477336.1 unnamed protein product [Schistosoma intercalatum]